MPGDYCAILIQPSQLGDERSMTEADDDLGHKSGESSCIITKSI